MQNIYLLLVILLMGISCKEQKTKEQPLAAQETAVKVRDHWKEVEKPIHIEVEGLPSNSSFQSATFSVCTDMTGNCVPCRIKGNRLQADGKGLSSEDTTVSVRLCFPYRKDLSSEDTLHLKQPFGERLYGIEQSRTIGEYIRVGMKLHSSLSMLRINIESDHLSDMLDELWIYGESLISEADYLPYHGKWLNRKENGILTTESDDCLLNNGRNHDFHLVPTGKQTPITLFAKVNKRDHALKTTLPPLQAGSLIQLNLKVGKSGQLHVESSWVESERTLSVPFTTKADSVRIGCYLQYDGTISMKKDSLSIGIVIETNGRHGKAVALEDVEGIYTFGNRTLSSGKVFLTIDGKRTEGIVNPTHENAADEDERIIFKPEMPYPDNCALGYTNGEILTERLVGHSDNNSLADAISQAHTGLFKPSKQMLSVLSRHKGSYIPSLGEMVHLYYLLQPYSEVKMPDSLIPLQGEYLTSSESSGNSFYMMDMQEGIINGSASKSYSRGRIRLFYLF